MRVVKTFNKYLEITERRREGKTQLKSQETLQEDCKFHSVIKKLLELANITVFKKDSSQSIFTSKVNLKVCLSQIFQIEVDGQMNPLGKIFCNKQIVHQRRKIKRSFLGIRISPTLNEDGMPKN